MIAVLILVLVVVVALSIPLGARTGAHIEIEVLESRMSAAFAKWSMILMKALGVALLVVMAWRLWHAGQSASRFGETTQQLLISYEPFYYLLAVSVGVYAFVLILDIIELLRGFAKAAGALACVPQSPGHGDQKRNAQQLHRYHRPLGKSSRHTRFKYLDFDMRPGAGAKRDG